VGAGSSAVGWGIRSRKVVDSIPDGVIWIFHWCNPFGRTVSRGSTQPLTEMNTRNTSWGRGVNAADAWGWQLYHLHVPIILKYGSLKFPEPSGPVQVCLGIVLPFTHTWRCDILKFWIICMLLSVQSNKLCLKLCISASCFLGAERSLFLVTEIYLLVPLIYSVCYWSVQIKWNGFYHKHFYILPTDAHYYKIIEMLRQFKGIILSPTCFGSRRNHHQGSVVCVAKTTKWFFVLVVIDAVNVMAAFQPVALACGSPHASITCKEQ
jgi:hypothetical protein